MDNYTKTIELKFKADKESLNKTKKEANEELSPFKEFTIGFSNEFKKDKKSADEYGKIFANKIKDAFSWGAEKIKDTLSDAWRELGEIVSYSTLSNQRTRDLAFTYGFSGSQAYGYQTAMDIMGFSGMEDLMYAESWQKELFGDYFKKYTEKYNELYDSGFFQNYLEFQYEMQDFKQEMLTEVVKFFVDNKDTIKSGMLAIMKLAEFAISALGSIVNFLGGNSPSYERSTAIASDIINNYSGGSSSSLSVKIDNTFNNVAKEDQTWLANAGQMTYGQVIEAIKRR